MCCLLALDVSNILQFVIFYLIFIIYTTIVNSLMDITILHSLRAEFRYFWKTSYCSFEFVLSSLENDYMIIYIYCYYDKIVFKHLIFAFFFLNVRFVWLNTSICYNSSVPTYYVWTNFYFRNDWFLIDLIWYIIWPWWFRQKRRSGIWREIITRVRVKKKNTFPMDE